MLYRLDAMRCRPCGKGRKERKKERKGKENEKERKGKERKGKERKGKERKVLFLCMRKNGRTYNSVSDAKEDRSLFPSFPLEACMVPRPQARHQRKRPSPL
jgi:hypothetical protein